MSRKFVMSKKWRSTMVCLGLISLFLGAYLLIVESLIEREFANLRQGTADPARIQSLAKYPFVQKDIVTYNANLAAIYASNQPETAVRNLHTILLESSNPELRFRTSLLLGKLYSTVIDGQNAQEALMRAVEMYVQALKIKPDDLLAKLALEKLLSQSQFNPGRDVKKEIKQGRPKPKDQEHQKSWSPGSKGDDI